MKELPKNQLNRRENEKIFTGWKNGDWWENGVCNPRKSFKDPVTSAFEASILANGRGRDRFGNPIFRK